MKDGVDASAKKSESIGAARRERKQSRPIITEGMAKERIAQKVSKLSEIHESLTQRRSEKKHLSQDLANVKSTLPLENDRLGKLTGMLSSKTREGWAKAATLQNSLSTVEKDIANLKKRYDAIKGEIDDVVLDLVKGEARWRKASTVERCLVVLRIAARAYSKAVNATKHRANGILMEKNDHSLFEDNDNEEGSEQPEKTFAKNELTALLVNAYDAGDAFLKALGEYTSAMDKPPPWEVEIPIGKNVNITVNLLQNKELLNIYTPESIGALEERLDSLSKRLTAARKEIKARYDEVRSVKNSYFHQKKAGLSTHFG